MGASLLYKGVACSNFKESQEGFSLDTKSNIQWDGLLLTQKTAPIKKCVSSLFVEKDKAIFIFGTGVSQNVKSLFRLVAIKSVLGHVSINAP